MLLTFFMNDFLKFRNEYPEFVYHDFFYEFNENSLNIKFDFEIVGLARFAPQWTIDKKFDFGNSFDKNTLENLIFSLGFTELISYWKATCSPKITVKCGGLCNEQKEWWQKLFVNGLGEFFYKNDVKMPLEEPLFKVECDDYILQKKMSPSQKNDKVLIPIGGGKDSVVTIELLKDYADRFCYIINPRKATLDTFTRSGVGNLLTAKRSIDKKLLDLNEKKFMNGHTPFSAIVAFSSVICAYINGISNVALSNESSANDPTVESLNINHQYSKSYEFEQDFIQYEDKFISSNVAYFSFLRPYTELKIASIFANYENYHDIFQSCNVGSKTDIWCLKCSKCLFVYIMLSPFLSVEKLDKIFSKNLLNDISLIEDFKKLIGMHPEKPFECVGSRDEVNAALQFTIGVYEEKNADLPVLLSIYKEIYSGEKFDLNDFLSSFDKENSVPQFLKNALI